MSTQAPPDYLPVHDNHAIISTGFEVQLKDALSDTQLTLIENSHEKLQTLLPAMRRDNQKGIQISNTGIVKETGTTLELAYLLPNGNPSWLARIQGDSIFLECQLYSRWPQVRDRALNIFDLLFEEIQIPISRAALIYTDQFFQSGTKSNAKTLFKPSKFIQPFLLEQDSAWHNRMGWFTNFEERQNHKVLNNLDIEIRGNQHYVQGSKRIKGVGFSCNLRHIQSIPLEIPYSRKRVATVLDILHAENKEIVAAVLSDSMIKKIDLWPK